jgi:hypothetical protein
LSVRLHISVNGGKYLLEDLSPCAQCGRIQAGHVGVVRMKSFIVGKGKGITFSTEREGLCTRGKRLKRGPWFILGHFYTTLNLEAGRDYVSLPGFNDLRARGRSRAYHYLAPLTFKPGGGAGHVTPVYTYVDSQVPHP